MYVQVLKCDGCDKLIEDESKALVVTKKELAFCEDCIRSVKGFQKKFKNLRAYHILVDIIANMLADEEIAEAEKKKSSTSKPAATGAGFSPPVKS